MNLPTLFQKPTVDAVMAPMMKAITNLKAVEESRAVSREAAIEKANKLAAEAAEDAAEIECAVKMRGRLESMLGLSDEDE